MVITDERLREITESRCLCVDCEPDLVRDEVRPMAEELLRMRAFVKSQPLDEALLAGCRSVE